MKRLSRPVVLTDFLLANKPVAIDDDSPLRQSINATGSITLSYAERMISFKFAALNYRAPRQSAATSWRASTTPGLRSAARNGW